MAIESFGERDVAYLLSGVPTAFRQEHEGALIQAYHQALCSEPGMKDYKIEQCIYQYFFAMFTFVIIWIIGVGDTEDSEDGREQGRLLVTRFCTMMKDWDFVQKAPRVLEMHNKHPANATKADTAAVLEEVVQFVLPERLAWLLRKA